MNGYLIIGIVTGLALVYAVVMLVIGIFDGFDLFGFSFMTIGLAVVAAVGLKLILGLDFQPDYITLSVSFIAGLVFVLLMSS